MHCLSSPGRDDISRNEEKLKFGENGSKMESLAHGIAKSAFSLAGSRPRLHMCPTRSATVAGVHVESDFCAAFPRSRED